MMQDWLQPRAERFRFLPQESAVRGSLPWIVALMVLLAVLGLAAGVSLASGVGVMEAGLGERFTVQIVEANPDLKAEKVTMVANMLSETEGVGGIEILADEELRGLLEPWLGSGNVGEDLPLPAMIDAEATNAEVLAALSSRLETDVPGARVDDHAGWLAPIGRLAWVLAAVALFTALLVIAAMAAIIVLGVRAGLGRHAETIDVLHLIGAEDSVITHLFQYRMAMVAGLGAAVGFGAALILLLTVGALVDGVGSGLASAAGLPWWGWMLVVMVPILAVLLSVITTRITVEHTLADVL